MINLKNTYEINFINNNNDNNSKSSSNSNKKSITAVAAG